MKTVLVGLAVVIAVGLFIVLRDVTSRGKRRRKFADQDTAQRAAEDAPVPGLADLAAAQNWQGPQDDPGFQSGDTVKCIGNLTIALHAALDPDSWRRTRCRDLGLSHSNGLPTYCLADRQRLVHCYRGQLDGYPFVVGNAYTTIPIVRAAAYNGPLPAGEDLEAAFCVLTLPPRPVWIQLVPAIRGPLSGSRHRSGHPDLDARYTLLTFNLRAGSQLITDQLAALVASRDGWAFTLYRNALICVTLAPLGSGDDARQLTSATAQAAAMLSGG